MISLFELIYGEPFFKTKEGDEVIAGDRLSFGASIMEIALVKDDGTVLYTLPRSLDPDRLWSTKTISGWTKVEK